MEAESQFELKDNLGSTISYSGTATTTPASVTGGPGNIISGALITAVGSNVEVSFDLGTTYYPLPRNATMSWDAKGEIRELFIRTSGGSRQYACIINFEDY